MKFGKQLKDLNVKIIDVTNNSLFSGMFLLLKSSWKRIGGAITRNACG